MSRKEKPSTEMVPLPPQGETFEEVLARRLSRRAFLKGTAGVSAALVAASALGHAETAQAAPAGFTPIKPQPTDVDKVVVPDGYTVDVLIRWGDPLTSDAPEFDVAKQTAEGQAKQFGYNNDMIAYFPLPMGSGTPDHGLLAVNHEYTNPELMFQDYQPEEGPTKEQAAIELAAHGISIVEVKRGADGKWTYDRTSRYNRRITADGTQIAITGPAAGHEWLKTSADPTGKTVIGTLNNCAGGVTPWGTYVSAEENFHQYFANLDAVADGPVKASHKRYGLPEKVSELQWEKHFERFDLAKEPNEPFRFGWLVEVDPYDPTSTPKKRTAMGRFRHEAATFVVAKSGKVVGYSGDDARFEYVYKFVTDGTYDKTNRAANMDLLDSGTLYVAKFNDDGSGEWIPLVAGQGPLTAEKGFASQADVCINTRQAADAVGATKMDRPEDIEASPVTGKVYIMLTNNTKREEAQVDKANPRANNKHGHVIELIEDGNDHAATTFKWEILLRCGDPATDTTTYFAGYDPKKVSPISCPDNCTFDNEGNLWIATDGQPGAINYNDALFKVPVEGSERGHVQQFLAVVAGAETCGPLFTPDNKTLFIAVQHPGEGGKFDEPKSTWPDGKAPPRPSVITVRANDGGVIGKATSTTPVPGTTPMPATGGETAPTLWIAAAGITAAAVGAFLRRRSQQMRQARVSADQDHSDA